MSTSGRLVGLVLLLALVAGGGYFLYGEHQRQKAERAAADAASAAGEPAAETAAPAGTPPQQTAAAPATEPGDATSSSAASGETGPAAETPATAAATPADTAAAQPAPPAGEAPPATAAEATPQQAAPAPETITQPEPTVAPEPGVPTFDVVRVEPGGDAVMAGRSEPGMVIALFANGKEIGRTRANQSGEWVITLEQPLGPGDYVITVVGASDDGKRQVESVDRIAVSIPDEKNEAPLVALMSPDAPTKVLQQPDAPAPTKVAGNTAAATGTEPQAAAEAATAATPAGATAAVTPPPAWTQTLAAGADIGGAAPGAGASTALPPVAEPNAAASAALAVGVVEKDDGRINVSGASLPGAKVRVYVDDALIGETTADAAGRWTLSAPHEVEAGAHSVRIDQVEPASGAVIARSEVPFDVLSTAEIAAAPATPDTTSVALPATDPMPAAPAATDAAQPPAASAAVAEPEQKAAKPAAGEKQARTIRIRRGDDLWTLAQRLYGKKQGVRYTAIYRANRKQIRDPNLIYPGQVFVIPR